MKTKLTGVMGALLAAGLMAMSVGAHADASTDGQLMADHAGYKAQQGAIQALNDTGQHRVASYSLAKAQCWLDVSFHEYTRNDRSDFPGAALIESRKITDYLAAGGDPLGADNPALKTPLVNGAAKLRDDLWTTAGKIRAGKGLRCAQQIVACGEVELVHAGNEHNQQGWRHAKPYVQIAEDLIGDAQRAADNCGDDTPKVQVPVPPPPPPVVPPAPVKQKVIEKITLGASALFHFDRRDEANILPGGRDQLDRLIDRLGLVYSKVNSITVTGHTDRLGTDAYNAQLGLDRAKTVAQYLQSHGVKTEVKTAGRGPTEPVVFCSDSRDLRALQACLQPNRRVELTIEGELR